MTRISLNVQVDCVLFPTINYPKVIGVTFISIFKSSAHSHLTAMKLELQNKALESLAQGKPLSSREGERERGVPIYERESL